MLLAALMHANQNGHAAHDYICDLCSAHIRLCSSKGLNYLLHYYVKRQKAVKRRETSEN
jgi:hypothetical protein